MRAVWSFWSKPFQEYKGRMWHSPHLAQCPEDHPPLAEWCGPHEVERAFARCGASLPAEWEWARSHGLNYYREANCGIMGGTRLDFIRYYANLAIDLVLDPEYADAWATFDDRAGYNMVVEQFLLSACIEFHRSDPGSPFRGIHMRYLFPSFAEAFDPEAALRAGYTHLLGDAKRDASVAARLEQRSRHEDRNFYRHCVQLSQNRSVMAGMGV